MIIKSQCKHNKSYHKIEENLRRYEKYLEDFGVVFYFLEQQLEPVVGAVGLDELACAELLAGDEEFFQAVHAGGDVLETSAESAGQVVHVGVKRNRNYLEHIKYAVAY
eukprot:TRINITY_DN8024_c0_g1_i9.p3 TRINITY_DN8024_c0_g1~~TRINITY_DN8024_c0_g1_i9.p3  ORF type:complete len:108 (+),score=15.95 TRINITY_DN8024_c0_g1_i9:443-766(+)